MSDKLLLRVSEYFSSIQGEGLASGRPCFFVRLSGCNLRCRWCDTSYAWHGGDVMSADDILAAWKASGLNLVQITGGEPLAQGETVRLMQMFVDAGAEVVLETNGSIDICIVPPGVTLVVDRKTPSSGMAGAWRDCNAARLGRGDQIKFVIGTRYDYEWSRCEIRRLNLRSSVCILFSPVAGIMEPARLAEWIVRDRLDVRFQLQVHKVLWSGMRGV